MGFIRDFKEFISRGNVVDLAVGVIIGGAFGTITTSLVNDVVMPPIGLLLAGIDFSKLKYVLKDAYTDAAGKEHAAVAINYGAFIQTLVNFLIISLVIFIVIRIINNMRRKQEAKGEAAPEAPSAQEALLTDIRDILKNMDEKRI